MGKQLEVLNGGTKLSFDKTDVGGKAKTFKFTGLGKTINRNLIFKKEDIKFYTRFNRYGYIDLYNNDTICREFLFFTKPDLYIFANSSSPANNSLNPQLKEQSPFFRDAFARHPKALGQLQYSVKDAAGKTNPFMSLLSNTVTSKMDLPALTSESQETTNNIFGTNIQHRSHSIKSDNSFDFSLTFNDTAYLEIYTMVKAYDEYMRMLKTGELKMYVEDDTSSALASKFKSYVTNHIDPNQFSIYKFLVGSDGETILYYAKATGVYFVDVPRSEFSDPGADAFKYSISFHANFVEDCNPLILSEFNRISPGRNATEFLPVMEKAGVNNTWGRWPRIIQVSSSQDKRVARRGVAYDYRLKWT